MKRIVPGLALAGFWLLLLLSGSFVLFWLVVSLLALYGAYEYLRMVLPQSATFADLGVLTAAAALPALLSGLYREDGVGGGVFVAAALSLWYVLSNSERLEEERFTLLAKLLFGVLFVGFFAAHLVLIWMLPEGNIWLIILVAITAGSDSGAYYFGRRWGRRKLCRQVSPNKTVEGALGGLLCGCALAALCAGLLLDGVNWAVLLPMALVLNGAGILGDLCESIVKRGTNTKDSGSILLGHGGVLDRVDSLLFAAPLLYYVQAFTV